MTSRRTIALAAVAVVLAACSSQAPTPAASTTSPEYQQAYKVGLDAYVYGLPLLVTHSTYRTMTSVNVSQGAYGPVNQFNNVRSTNTSSSTAVVAPGASSLSSIAWLDLRDEPQVLHVPRVKNHNFVLALLDPYTENLINLGNASHTAPGDYAILDPAQKDVVVPRGVRRIDVDHWRIWIIGSTELNGPDDVAAVNRIQDGYTLTPLSVYGTKYQPPGPAQPQTTVTQYAPAEGVQFFDQLGDQLAKFPPPAADGPALQRFASVGIGPGRSPSTDTSLSQDTLKGLSDAVAAGPERVQRDLKALYARDFGTHNGYLLGGFGRYGTDYAKRAVISQIGLGAFVSHQAMYAIAWNDRAKNPLNGSTTYRLHMSKPPPVRQSWSVTVYTLKGALVSNPENRYALNDTSRLRRNADGSVDLYLAATEPTDPVEAANWLPTPAGEGFEVMWRLIAPAPSAIDGILDGTGWQPPRITARQ